MNWNINIYNLWKSRFHSGPPLFTLFLQVLHEMDWTCFSIFPQSRPNPSFINKLQIYMQSTERNYRTYYSGPARMKSLIKNFHSIMGLLDIVRKHPHKLSWPKSGECMDFKFPNTKSHWILQNHFYRSSLFNQLSNIQVSGISLNSTDNLVKYVHAHHNWHFFS